MTATAFVAERVAAVFVAESASWMLAGIQKKAAHAEVGAAIQQWECCIQKDFAIAAVVEQCWRGGAFARVPTSTLPVRRFRAFQEELQHLESELVEAVAGNGVIRTGASLPWPSVMASLALVPADVGKIRRAESTAS